VLDVRLLPPLEANQQVIVSSVNHCLIQNAHDPLLVALGRLDPSQTGTQQVRDLQRAWRVNLETDRLDDVVTQGIACEVYLGGP